ncbi:BMC domain-containing protein [Hydrogeniiclostridium mannosilyticum]|uniref:Ethanolamine utilization protein EutM n=1 Tax=Hydrogeniiclostridium mannosilyticum TaxID=2764322 RepID=A0A328UH50_9FIRM|nr:BMC domain-containing protein [Hydrogeniiclostridium mannosilyticum]MBS6163125.1 BMC domain-containing protein [Clostridiales bacterium]RAQ30401.1 ethanolamine utilization protein EutM [Hydrogeniiclostridium mannosilyticum]
MEKAIALLEVQGLTAAIEGLDAMLKAADVRLIHIERRLGGRLVTMVVDGTVADVQAAAEAGKEAASHIGKVKLSEVLPRPHPEVKKFLYTNVKEE